MLQQLFGKTRPEKLVHIRATEAAKVLGANSLPSSSIFKSQDLPKLLQRRYAIETLNSGGSGSKDVIKMVQENRTEKMGNQKFPLFEIRHFFQLGASVVMNGFDRFSEGADKVSNALFQETHQCPVHCNMYLSPADSSSRAFTFHYDPWDVFVIQQQGSKRWQIGERPYFHQGTKASSNDGSFTDAKASRSITENEIFSGKVYEVEVKEGDILFIPNRVPHRAISTNPSEPSVHLTFGIENARRSYLSILQTATAQAVFGCAGAIGQDPGSPQFTVRGVKNCPNLEGAYVKAFGNDAASTIYECIPKPAFNGDWNEETNFWTQKNILGRIEHELMQCGGASDQLGEDIGGGGGLSMPKQDIFAGGGDVAPTAAEILFGKSPVPAPSMDSIDLKKLHANANGANTNGNVSMNISALCYDGQTREVTFNKMSDILSQAREANFPSIFANIARVEAEAFSSLADVPDVDFLDFSFLRSSNPMVQTSHTAPYFVEKSIGPKGKEEYSVVVRGQRIGIPTKELVEPVKWVLGRYTGSKGEPFRAKDVPNLDAVGFCLSLGLVKHVK